MCRPCVELLSVHGAQATEAHKQGSRCEICKEELTGDCIAGLNGGHMHRECFICCVCNKQIGSTYVRKGLTTWMHKECASEANMLHVNKGSESVAAGLINPKILVDDPNACGACHLELDGACVTAINKKSYHKACFKCSTCSAAAGAGYEIDSSGIITCKNCKSKKAVTQKQWVLHSGRTQERKDLSVGGYTPKVFSKQWGNRLGASSNNCKNCGAANSAAKNFCEACGAKVVGLF